jgi:hypothetical protein
MVRITLTRVVERLGRIHQPGDSITVPMDEATSLIRMGFAMPQGAPVEVDPRPIRGAFKAQPRRPL